MSVSRGKTAERLRRVWGLGVASGPEQRVHVDPAWARQGGDGGTCPHRVAGSGMGESATRFS